MAGGCGRPRANRGVLCFSLRSLPPERTDRDRVDVALWHEPDLPRCPQFCRYRGESRHGSYERRLPSLTRRRHPKYKIAIVQLDP